jgi:hypothetical protein
VLLPRAAFDFLGIAEGAEVSALPLD